MSPAAVRLRRRLSERGPCMVMHLPYGRYLVAGLRVPRVVVDELETAGHAETYAGALSGRPILTITDAGIAADKALA